MANKDLDMTSFIMQMESMENIVTTTLNSINDEFISTMSTVTKEIKNVEIEISSLNEGMNLFDSTQKIITTSIGVASSALGGLSSIINIAKDNQKHLNIEVLKNPYVLAVAAITTFVTALGVLAGSMDSEFQKHQEIISSIHDEINAREELNNKQNEQINSNLSEVSNIQQLNKELSTLVDANGRVKEGYENRASFITSVLNKVLGTNLEIEKGVIVEYNDTAKAIKEKIAVMQAEAILEAQYPKYQKAKENLSTAIKKADELQIQMSKDKMAMMNKESELNKEYGTSWKTAQDAQSRSLRDGYNQLEQNFISSQSAYDLQRGVVEGHYDDIALYETNYALASSGNIDNINNMQTESLVHLGEIKESKKALLEEDITNETDNINRLKELKEGVETEAEQNELQKQIDAKEKKIENDQAEIDAMIEHGAKLAELKQINNAEDLEALSSYIASKQEKLIDMYAIEEINWTEEQKKKAEALKNSISEELVAYTSYASDKVGKAVELSSKLTENSTQEEKDAAAAAMREATTTLQIMGQNVKDKLVTVENLRARKASGEKGITEDMIKEAERQAVEAEKGYGKVAEKVEKSWKGLPKSSQETFKNVMSPMLEEMEKKEPFLFSKANEIAGGILGNLKKAFDINSPSRKVKKIFMSVMEGAEVGLEDMTPELMNQADEIAENVLDVFSKVNESDVRSMAQRMNAAMNSEQVHMRGIVNSNFAQEMKENRSIKVEIPKLIGTIKGEIENHILMDGRETAVQLSPFISEEIAFSSH